VCNLREAIGQLLFEGLLEIGLESLLDSVQPARESRPSLAAPGHLRSAREPGRSVKWSYLIA
jgi:hypothetical protein